MSLAAHSKTTRPTATAGEIDWEDRTGPILAHDSRPALVHSGVDLGNLPCLAAATKIARCGAIPAFGLWGPSSEHKSREVLTIAGLTVTTASTTEEKDE